MKVTQNNFVKSLPKIIIFGIAFYNFVWIVWQNSKGCSGIACPWYFSNSFPIEAFLLLIAAYLLFIPHWIAKAISGLIGGYFAVSWTWMIVNWFWITDYSLLYWIQSIKSQYFGHPLQVWESQVLIAISIFRLSIYNLGKKHRNSFPLLS